MLLHASTNLFLRSSTDDDKHVNTNTKNSRGAFSSQGLLNKSMSLKQANETVSGSGTCSEHDMEVQEDELYHSSISSSETAASSSASSSTELGGSSSFKKRGRGLRSFISSFIKGVHNFVGLKGSKPADKSASLSSDGCDKRIDRLVAIHSHSLSLTHSYSITTYSHYSYDERIDRLGVGPGVRGVVGALARKERSHQLPSNQTKSDLDKNKNGGKVIRIRAKASGDTADITPANVGNNRSSRRISGISDTGSSSSSSGSSSGSSSSSSNSRSSSSSSAIRGSSSCSSSSNSRSSSSNSSSSAIRGSSSCSGIRGSSCCSSSSSDSSRGSSSGRGSGVEVVVVTHY